MSNTLSTSNNCTCSASQQSATASNIHGTTAVLQHEGVALSLENLRRLPNISQAVTNALAAYADQAKSTLLGKQRRSGHYNTTDISQNPPEIRWPNEGFHSSSGKKGVPYDELSMAQWTLSLLNMPSSRSSWLLKMQHPYPGGQMSMANSQLTQQHNSKKICKFYNDGTCSYENHHGAYMHIYSYCDRLGRVLQHPEVKCNSKNKPKDRQTVKS